MVAPIDGFLKAVEQVFADFAQVTEMVGGYRQYSPELPSTN